MEEKIEKIEKIISGLTAMKEVFEEQARKLRDTEPEDSFSAFRMSCICEDAAEKLQRDIPQEMELEGGGNSWWFLCPECRGEVNSRDMFCWACGQALKALKKSSNSQEKQDGAVKQ